MIKTGHPGVALIALANPMTYYNQYSDESILSKRRREAPKVANLTRWVSYENEVTTTERRWEERIDIQRSNATLSQERLEL